VGQWCEMTWCRTSNGSIFGSTTTRVLEPSPSGPLPETRRQSRLGRHAIPSPAAWGTHQPAKAAGHTFLAVVRDPGDALLALDLATRTPSATPPLAGSVVAAMMTFCPPEASCRGSSEPNVGVALARNRHGASAVDHAPGREVPASRPAPRSRSASLWLAIPEG